MNKERKTWCVIGDSFTFIDNHLEETNYRIKEGYVTKTAKLLSFDVEIINLGINGATTSSFLNMDFPQADFYSIFLGANDWWSVMTPFGDFNDYINEKEGSTAGDMGLIIKAIRKAAITAPIFIASPVERGLFVYQFDYYNNALDSTHEKLGKRISDYAKLYKKMEDPTKGIFYVDTHGLAGFTPENAVLFMRKTHGGKTEDLPFEVFHNEKFDPLDFDEYPYPLEAENMTYDGLHPSERGGQKIAEVFAQKINSVFVNQKPEK